MLRSLTALGFTSAAAQAILKPLEASETAATRTDMPGSSTVEGTGGELVVAQAKAAGAQFLLEGSYTLADPGIRITLQLFDLRTNAYIGAAKATGPLKDLFALEDSIADQVKRLAQNQLRLLAPPAAPQPALPPLAIPGNGPVQVQFPWDRDKPFIANEIRKTLLDSDYEDSRYRMTYTYPTYGYYGYGYAPYYGPIVYFPRPVLRGAYFFHHGFLSVGW